MSTAQEDEKLKFEIALTLIPGVGSVIAKNLVSYCGSPEAVFKSKESLLLKIPEVGKVVASQIINHSVFESAEKEVSAVRKKKIETVFYTEKNYPARLKNCIDAPVMLFYKGDIDFNPKKTIAIVGTRNATDYGKNFCETFISDLQKHNVQIVSGLAYGIDICAHKAALKNNLSTVAVLAHGLDRIYPSVHKSTTEKMLDNGGIVSEFITGTNPDRENFPKRNRIVAGMCDAVIVVEASLKGGALITADIASSYNRDVFALPGRIQDEYSQGCNSYIKINKAAMIESATDLEYQLGWDLLEKLLKENC
jgi:DNA processing protein